MIKTTIFFLLTVLLVNGHQAPTRPFSQFEKELQNERGGWAGNKERLSKHFDDERRRLGEAFEPELLKWLGSDLEKHYWVSSFVESESYLHGNKPLLHLSLLIQEQGLALGRGREDEESLGYVVGLNVTAAILSSQLGFPGLARAHKFQAERLMLQNPNLSASFPALSEVDRRRYEGIESGLKGGIRTITADNNPQPHAKISGGIMNGRASNLVKPSYPPDAREAGASGQVEVRIVIDEGGNVIWVRTTSGHPLLRKAAEDAAWQTKFPVIKLSGIPVRVSGVLLYNFVR